MECLDCGIGAGHALDGEEVLGFQVLCGPLVTANGGVLVELHSRGFAAKLFLDGALEVFDVHVQQPRHHAHASSSMGGERMGWYPRYKDGPTHMFQSR